MVRISRCGPFFLYDPPHTLQKRKYLRWALKVLSTAIASTFIGYRKYVHFLGALCFFRGVV